MKVLIISSDEIDVSNYNAIFDILRWEEVNNRDDINFSDYDGLVLDANSLRTVKRIKPGIGFYTFEKSLNCIAIRDILGRKNSFVFVIGNPSTMMGYESIADCVGFKVEARSVSGTVIGDFDTDGRFAPYWRSIGSYEYYIESISAGSVKNIMKSGSRVEPYDTITTRSGYIIGTCVSIDDSIDDEKVFEGILSFVPVLATGKKDTIQSLLGLFLENGEQTEPVWAKQLTVVRQEVVDDDISKVNDRIEALRGELASLNEKREIMRQPIEVLYKANKALENSVATLLEAIGFEVMWPEKKNEVEYYIKAFNEQFVVEVKSTRKETFGKKGLNQVVEWQMDKLYESGEDFKALLITSNQFDKPLNERNEDILPPNLLAIAEKYDICVLPVTTLYDISQRIADGKYSLEDFVKIMKRTKGIIKISRKQK